MPALFAPRGEGWSDLGQTEGRVAASFIKRCSSSAIMCGLTSSLHSLDLRCPALRRQSCRHYFISMPERDRMVAWREGKCARAELEVLA